jgi:hypothetical protein
MQGTARLSLYDMYNMALELAMLYT